MSLADPFIPAVGDSFRLKYETNPGANRLIHVRAIVDNEYIVYRYWRHNEWIYKMTDPTYFEVGLASGHMTKVKAK